MHNCVAVIDAGACLVDAYLLAAQMTDDAVLPYHTALELHGKAYSVFEEIQYLSGQAARPAGEGGTVRLRLESGGARGGA